jgi:hypothetical protein
MDADHIDKGGQEVFVELQDLAELGLRLRFSADGEEAYRRVRTEKNVERVLFACALDLLRGFLRPLAMASRNRRSASLQS